MANPVINFIRNVISGSAFRSGQLQQTNIWGMSSREVYATIDQQNAVEKGFNANTAVYSIVKKDAKKFGSIERYLENKQTDEAFNDTHPLMILLNRPNPHQSQDAFLTTVRAYYKICGEAFIWLNRGDATQMVNDIGQLVDRTLDQYLAVPITEMYVLPSNQMVIIPDPEDPYNILGYQLQNRPDIKWRKEDIIHWKDINLDWELTSKPHLRGMTALRPGHRSLQADNSATDSMVRMFQNDGAKGALANKTIGKMSPTQQTQLQNVMDSKVNNKDIKNAIAALEGDWTYLNFGLTSVDMETIHGREFIYKELCFLFGVPYAFFDSQVTWDNAAARAREWISNEIMPDSCQLDGELNRMLLPAFKLTSQQAAICSNFDNLPELQEDKAKQVEWMMKAPISLNEIREALGYEENTDPAMDDIYIPTTLQPITGDAAANAQMITDIQNMTNAANGGTNRANGNEKVPGNP